MDGAGVKTENVLLAGIVILQFLALWFLIRVHLRMKRNCKLQYWYFRLLRPTNTDELMKGLLQTDFIGTVPFTNDEILEYGKQYDQLDWKGRKYLRWLLAAYWHREDDDKYTRME